MKLKPATAKGTYMRSVTISTTHGPGIKVDTDAVHRAGSPTKLHDSHLPSAGASSIQTRYSEPHQPHDTFIPTLVKEAGL